MNYTSLAIQLNAVLTLKRKAHRLSTGTLTPVQPQPTSLPGWLLSLTLSCLSFPLCLSLPFPPSPSLCPVLHRSLRNPEFPRRLIPFLRLVMDSYPANDSFTDFLRTGASWLPAISPALSLSSYKQSQLWEPRCPLPLQGYMAWQPSNHQRKKYPSQSVDSANKSTEHLTEAQFQIISKYILPSICLQAQFGYTSLSWSFYTLEEQWKVYLIGRGLSGITHASEAAQ